MSSVPTVEVLETAVEQMILADEREQRKNKLLNELLDGDEHKGGIFDDSDDDFTSGVVDKNTVNVKVAPLQPADKEEDKLILTALESTDENLCEETPTQRVQTIPNQHLSTRAEPVKPPVEPQTPPAKKASVLSSMFSSFKSFTQSFSNSSTKAPVKPKPIHNHMRRVRNENVTALLFETFAFLDKDKDGKISQDEAWTQYLLVFSLARTLLCSPEYIEVYGKLWDNEVWESSKQDFEDALGSYPKYLISHEVWCDFFSEIDLDDDTLEKLMIEALKRRANK